MHIGKRELPERCALLIDNRQRIGVAAQQLRERAAQIVVGADRRTLWPLRSMPSAGTTWR